MLSIKNKLWLKQTLKPFLKPVLTWWRQNSPTASTSKLEDKGTQYHEKIDKRKLRALAPYKVEQSDVNLEDVFNNVNYNFYSAYGPDFNQKDCMALSVDGPLDYQRFLTELKNRVPNLSSNTFAHYIPSNQLENDEVACIIRHDVDGDLVAAVQQAKIEESLGYKTSYFILHTAPYYGEFQADGRFFRNDESLLAYQDLQSYDHEIALHTDGMLVYQEYGVDGAQCVREEIEWLRSNDIDLVGTTAHNSWPSYGVENFTIFAGKDRGKGEGMRAVTHNGKWAPLGMLNEIDMKLTYEANELLWQRDTPVFYAALRSQNIWRVSFYNYSKELLNEEHSFGSYAEFNNNLISTDDLLDLIQEIQSPAYLYLVVHPMHYGLRAAHDQPPWLPTEPQELTVKSMHCVANREGETNNISACAISKKNEFDTYDRGLDCYSSAEQRLIVLGDLNLATNKLSVDTKFSQVAAQYTARATRTPRTAAIGVTFDTPSLSDYQNAIAAINDKALCDHIIVCIDGNHTDTSSIADWTNNASNDKSILLVLTTAAGKEHAFSLSKFNQDRIIAVETIFAAYKGSASLFLDEEQGLWSAQGHHLVGRAIASALS